MKTLFDICFGVVKFAFKAIFWVGGLIIMLLAGSCTDYTIKVFDHTAEAAGNDS